VGHPSAQLGQAYGLSTKEIQELKTVGHLHDIGKIAVDESILNKKGKLDQKEWEAIRRHPEIGWKILSAAGELGEFASIVLAHHERIDGRGYPQGLTGEQIPLAARMIAIADAFDAMTATRSYKEAIGENEAASELKRCAGTQFDKHLAHVFVEQVLHLDWEAM
jgi:HD-GYP domain-containing protein (c-di-GMP phosphodiesterase class II)